MLKLNNYTNYILKDICFEIKKGNNIIILGDNGAGKTTLAKVLCGLIENDNTTIENKKVKNLWKEDRYKNLNYIPNKLEIFDEYLSVEEFLDLSFFNKNITINDVLKLLKIEYLRDKSCKDLSSGESQLVLIATAILQDSVFTIFDEISSNLDPNRQKDIFDLFKNSSHLQSKIIITHNLDFAYKLGFDIAYMQNGKVIYKGTSDSFFDQKNLDILFDCCVKKHHGHIVVDL